MYPTNESWFSLKLIFLKHDSTAMRPGKGESMPVNAPYAAAPNAFSSSLISSAWFQGSWADAGGCRVCTKLILIPDDLPFAADRGRV